ncbi:ABC transporter ATP-binding protein [Paracoccus pantotrophus]|uniref:ABC transporter ATP-binding protein n=1 Tax=Paracoccus pantotrophus TaxID=82367 RepID=UPI00048F0133|nr:ABC transporter ATP-binding protein [Paracoccus pantotrophus]
MTQSALLREKGSPLLEIRDLRVDGFSDERWHQIVKGVDLTLNRGEVLGLIGESGAGKSTIGLAAMGYAKPGCKITGGRILFDREDLANATEARCRDLRGTRIAYVAQSAAASFNPAKRLIDQTIESVVRRRLMSVTEARKKAMDLYRQLQLPSPETIGDRYPHQVSGGQLQRAMTAMAMVSSPDLIIFDEPTTALDVTTQVEVLASIRSLVERHNTAALYITHDLAVVAQMTDRIMVLRHGAEVECAPTRQMISAPQADYTKTLWAVRELTKPQQPGGEPLLTVRNLQVHYGSKIALDDVSITVPRGRTVSLVGESGSGKSTLGRAICGLLPPTSGRIEYDGKPLPPRLAQRDASMLRRIQMIHQLPDTALNPRHTVRDVIGRPIEVFQKKRGKALTNAVVELLDRIELGPQFLDRLPAEMSGGQKQRLCLARALAAEPDLIICDEVTSALDQVVQEEMLRLLMDIQKDLGVTYLFITHDIATVNAISDEVVVMNQGKVIEQGPKETILQPPYPAYTELLLSSVPEMDPDWLTRLLAQRRAKHGAAVRA